MKDEMRREEQAAIRRQRQMESLATVERMLREAPLTDQFQRLRLHLEQRREVLNNEISKGEVDAECIGSKSGGSITLTNTVVKG
jgi:hypothetical protein